MMVIWAAASILAGCGRGDGLEKAIVYGRVTYDGVPIKNGVLRFRPIGDTKGPANAAEIIDGKYRMDARGGAAVGMHRVEVIGYREKAVLPGSQPIGDQIADTAGEQFVPDQFNRNSRLELEIPSGQSPFERDFDLESSP